MSSAGRRGLVLEMAPKVGRSAVLRCVLWRSNSRCHLHNQTPSPGGANMCAPHVLYTILY
eukprot:310878-Pyramimonas_sp.AAC.1